MPTNQFNLFVMYKPGQTIKIWASTCSLVSSTAFVGIIPLDITSIQFWLFFRIMNLQQKFFQNLGDFMADIKEIQSKIRSWIENSGFKWSSYAEYCHLVEEVGELASSRLRNSPNPLWQRGRRGFRGKQEILGRPSCRHRSKSLISST